MDNYQWIDVTTELPTICKDLKMMEMVKDDSLTLEECMQAQQINDDKMDPKFDICYQHTIKYKIQEKLVKFPQQLNFKQMSTIFANIWQLQASVLKGQTFSSSIYTFAYLYDRKIWEDNYLFNALIESIHSLGTHIYDLIKQAGIFKQDDIALSSFSFSNKSKTHGQVIEQILQAQKKFEAQYQKSMDKEYFDFILNTLRLRRSLHSFAKITGISFDPKNIKKIETQLQTTKKKLAIIQQLTINLNLSEGLLNGVFFNDLSKTLKAHFPPRILQLISLQNSLKEVRNTLQQFELFFPAIPTKISEMRDKIQILQSKSYNSWSKSYIKSNVFTKENQFHFLSSIKSYDALVADINDWVHLKDNVKQHEKFKKLIEISFPIINQTLYRLLGNSMRWQWQASKVYEQYNVLIQVASQVDSTAVSGNKEFYISSWYYYYGLQLMVKQILVGFQINLYDVSELKYVFFVLDSLLEVVVKNSQVHLRKIDKSFQQHFNQDNFNKKLKKKMNDNQKKMFANIIFKKGLYTYFRALFHILCILHAKKLIEDKFEETEKLRIKNRFRLFKKVFFIKVIDYNEYRHTIEQIIKRQGEVLANTLQQLKQAKNKLSLFTKQLESHQTFFRQKQDAEILTKLVVKASIIVMTLKMNAVGNKKFAINLNGRFPDITME